jgi:hypothetical protein
MSEDARKRLHEGHGRVVQFLTQWRTVVEQYLSPKARILLRYALESGLKPAKEIRGELEKEFGPGDPAKTKVKTDLNEGLGLFCGDCDISPRIQMYFVSPELHKQIMHLGCYRLQEAAESLQCVSLSELEDVLDKASQLLTKKVEREKAGRVFEDIEPVVREVLKNDALEHLREKLKPKDENDYQRLELECGVVRTTEVQSDIDDLVTISKGSIGADGGTKEGRSTVGSDPGNCMTSWHNESESHGTCSSSQASAPRPTGGLGVCRRT